MIPESGTRWKGNLYRIDYDEGEDLYSWQLTSGNFHEMSISYRIPTEDEYLSKMQVSEQI